MLFRYPQDIHDRFWATYQREDWTAVNTSLNIDLSINKLDLPSEIMVTAATPKRLDYLDFNWQIPDNHPNNGSAYYVYMHFAEVQKLPSNQSRQFNIFHNEEFF